jgi:hypothetical protein
MNVKPELRDDFGNISSCFKVYIVSHMARAMGLTEERFNDIFRDAITPLGQHFASVWQAYSEYHLLPAARMGETYKWSTAGEVLDHIWGTYGKGVPKDVPAPANRKSWTELDWNAWVVWELFKMRVRSIQGPLRCHRLEDIQTYEIVWALRLNRMYHDKQLRPWRVGGRKVTAA